MPLYLKKEDGIMMRINDRLKQIDTNLCQLEKKQNPSEQELSSVLEEFSQLLKDIEPDRFDPTQMLKVQMLANRFTDISNKIGKNTPEGKALKEVQKLMRREF